MAKLNYFITGDYKTERKTAIVDSILKCVDIGANYEEFNVEKCDTNDDLVSQYMANAKKNKFNNFHIISIDLSDENDFVEVVEWERVGKSGNEWRGNPNTVKAISYGEFEEKIFETVNSFVVPPIR